MKYIYFRDPAHGNFGDDLNIWLWPKLFDNYSEDSDVAFFGIGSILFNSYKGVTESKNKLHKVVFGTGIRPVHSPFNIDSTWDIRFLRGPLSAISLGNKYEYIADAAYALRLTDEGKKLLSQKKKYKVSFMPYFRSVKYFDWKAICDHMGYHYISPLSENGVDFTLQEIAASEMIITEAMHGAIVADALRVPWNRLIFTTPITEGEMVSEFKWLDWLASVNVNNSVPTIIRFYRKTQLNTLLGKASLGVLNVEFFFKRKVFKDLINSLKAVDQFFLSEDDILELIDKKIEQKVIEVRKDFGLSK